MLHLRTTGFSSLILASILILLTFPAVAHTAGTPDGYLFYGQGCPHCGSIINYLQERGLFQRLNIEKKEVYFQRDNLKEFIRICQNYNIPEDQRGVPMLFYQGRCIIGDKPIIGFIKQIEQYNQEGNGPSPEYTTSSGRIQPSSLLAVISGTRSDSPNSATRPAPRGPCVPSECDSSTTSTQPWSSATSTNSTNGHTEPVVL